METQIEDRRTARTQANNELGEPAKVRTTHLKPAEPPKPKATKGELTEAQLAVKEAAERAAKEAQPSAIREPAPSPAKPAPAPWDSTAARARTPERLEEPEHERDNPVEQLELLDADEAWCSRCGGAIYMSPSGNVCAAGHGDAPLVGWDAAAKKLHGQGVSPAETAKRMVALEEDVRTFFEALDAKASVRQDEPAAGGDRVEALQSTPPPPAASSKLVIPAKRRRFLAPDQLPAALEVGDVLQFTPGPEVERLCGIGGLHVALDTDGHNPPHFVVRDGTLEEGFIHRPTLKPLVKAAPSEEAAHRDVKPENTAKPEPPLDLPHDRPRGPLRRVGPDRWTTGIAPPEEPTAPASDPHGPDLLDALAEEMFSARRTIESLVAINDELVGQVLQARAERAALAGAFLKLSLGEKLDLETLRTLLDIERNEA